MPKVFEAGLPNIKGTLTFRAFNDETTIITTNTNSSLGGINGALYGSAIHRWADGDYHANAVAASGLGYLQQLYIAANKYNSIYGNTTTVQPPAISLLPQIRY